jgi:iron complex outermembrane recepter protein
MRTLTCALIVVAIISTPTVATAAGAEDHSTRRIIDLSLEELMSMPVISVGKKETSLGDSPAAIAVITAEEIGRLGITSLPEALRLVPGLEVARINAHSWAISARGFTGQHSDKLLVLIDGRIIYESRFPGVYWDVQDLVLEDLDRIEVIRGPGATLWGANAVNGVINIITKRASDTPGPMASVSYGGEEHPTASARYGGSFGSSLHYRVFGKYAERAPLVREDGGEAADSWMARRGGFRLDWEPARANDTLTIQGDYHVVDGDEYFTRPQLTPPFSRTLNSTFESHGVNILGRWTRSFSSSSSLSMQAYYADSLYEDSDSGAHDHLADFEVQHRFRPAPRHDVVWGAGYRRRENVFAQQSRGIRWDEPVQRRYLQTAFVQDEISLVANVFHVTVGSKFEHNTTTGFSVAPSVRALWMPDSSQTVWGAVSQAFRTPDLFELGARLDVAAFQQGPNGPLVQVSIFGQPDLDPERLVAYELGYRAEPFATLSFDVATFYNRYDDLIEEAAGTPRFETSPAPAHLLIPLVSGNLAGARAFGVEASAQWRPARFWRVAPTYVYFDFPPMPGDNVGFDSPAHRFSVQSYLTLPKELELNGAAYYVGRLPSAKIDAYTRVDLGLVWRPAGAFELGIWGQNLLEARHVEFFAQTTPVREAVKRGVVAQITWRPTK